MRSAIVGFVVAGLFGVCSAVEAQEPPPPIPLFVVDLHANVVNFPDAAQLAQSRALSPSELPGFGMGGDAGVHVYPFKWHAITFGVGGQFSLSRAHRTPTSAQGQPPTRRAVTERFTSLAPQLSFNFGSGNGWSYLSGGIAPAKWSFLAEGSVPLPSDEERLKTINYGGGARWFVKPHLAFSFDVRFYAINPSTPTGPLPSSPRTTLMIISAGVSLK